MPTMSLLTAVSDLDSLQALRHSRPRDMMSLQRFLQRFGYEPDRLDALSHVPPDTARLNPFNHHVQAFMRQALDLVALKMVQARGLDAAIDWFKHEALPHFGDRTPEQVVADGGGAALLRDLHHTEPVPH